MRNAVAIAGLIIFGVTILPGRLCAAANPASTPTPKFNREVRPILSDNCYACHGPDKNTRKAKLRLDTPEGAYAETKEGKFPVVPGKPDDSELIKRITSTDPDEVMPPPKSGKKLTPQQIATLRQWVEAGAKFERHWACIQPQRPAIPDVKNRAWPINPIDYFILARLEREGLAPSPETDRRTLIRRLSFDLTGLPSVGNRETAPGNRKPAEFDYARLVRDLLNSPHFGERMTVPWLDLVRYSDTVGYHGDNPVSVWPYRDYVINSFNRNLPFDQFTRDQLAGDLLPNSSINQRIASGLNRMSTEGGIQDKEYLAKYASDRIRTISATWLGSTMGCSECHDHKFDPFTTRDFYGMEAFFADLREKGYYPDGYGKGDWGPKMRVPSESQARRLKEIETQIAALTNKLAAVPEQRLVKDRAVWEKQIDWMSKADRLGWKEVVPTKATSTAGSTLTIQTNGIVTASGKSPGHDDYVVTIPAIFPKITALRLEVLHDDSLPGNEIARAGDGFVLGEIEVAAKSKPDARPRPVQLVAASASYAPDGFPAMAAIDRNPQTGWGERGLPTKDRQAAFIFDHAVDGGPEAALIVTLRHSPAFPHREIGKFRLSLSEVDNANAEKNCLPADVLAALKMPADKRTTNQLKLVSDYHRSVAPQTRAMTAQLASLQRDHSLLVAEIPTTFVSETMAARTIRVLPRGDWMNETGDKVTPHVPQFLALELAAKTESTNRPTRLDLANWIVSTNNPLTARVFVNRLWKMYFGTGLSRTLDDFGIQGEWPTHPELLDWLAVEFMESGWDVKHMVALIVNSRTYRQSSISDPTLDERDPGNRLLARQSRFRVDAEFVRDDALAVSGLLVDRQGGPSVHPYQPDGYYASLNFPKREYVADEGAAQYRRGVYTHWQRTFLHPSLQAFDAASREECTANRINSNTPQQALVLLNDPTFVEAARVFAANIVQKGGRDFESRLNWAYQRALARPIQPAELSLLRGLFEKELAFYRTHEEAARELINVGFSPIDLGKKPLNSAPELAAWTAVARALLNLNETITRS